MDTHAWTCSAEGDALLLQGPFGALRLALPQVEVDGVLRQAAAPAFGEALREIRGGTERTLCFAPGGGALLELRLRCYAGSPFVRLRALLRGDGARLTHPPQGDRFCYTRLSLPAGSRVTEIQLNQYEATRHAYLPQRLPHPEAAQADICFAGPLLLAEGDAGSLLCGYEHGGEATDDFLHFRLTHTENGIEAALECGSGTYANGEGFSDAQPYKTPWFHIGAVPEGGEALLGHFRRFILHHQPESTASRQPYIFYNTWNNQERNRAFRGLKYLDNFDTAHMLAEIDVAHRMGIDVFVIDTGWYKTTGDWEVDIARFPDDLARIRQRLDGYGMQLGLWFNPAAAARSSRISREHPEYRKQKDGADVDIGPVWETEDSYGMCLVSDYGQWFADKLVDIGRRYGVRYFKWDAVDMEGCDSPRHHHGGEACPPAEREQVFRFKCGMALTDIAETVGRQLPGAIVDLDVTEGRRYVGLGFLAAGKFFHINNGPYYHDFDIPGARETYRQNWNAFFHPGAARSRVCRQALAYDACIPSLLFLAHFLPDKPAGSQRNALASLLLGGNGIWGDLHALDDADIRFFAEGIALYKTVAQDVTRAAPRVQGFIGASPEVHEKIDPETGRGMVVFFTRRATDVIYYTQCLPRRAAGITGADNAVWTPDGRLRLEVSLGDDDARVVFLTGKEDESL